VAYSHNTSGARAPRSRSAGEHWQITIANGGPGVAEAHLPYLFAVGQRSSVAEKTTRSGLGLYIARCCVRDHGSTLRLRTRPQLTVFSFAVHGLQRGDTKPAPHG